MGKKSEPTGVRITARRWAEPRYGIFGREKADPHAWVANFSLDGFYGCVFGFNAEDATYKAKLKIDKRRGRKNFKELVTYYD